MTMRPWAALRTEEQIQLQVEYGYFQDRLPPTCSLEVKNQRFARWLAEHGVAFGADSGDDRTQTAVPQDGDSHRR
ncbi:MAG: hypothetical protein ACFCUG_12820 [Thiotrichales bacterium]